MLRCSDLKSGMSLEYGGPPYPDPILVVSLEDAEQFFDNSTNRWSEADYDGDGNVLSIALKVLNVATGMIQEISVSIVFGGDEEDEDTEEFFPELTLMTTAAAAAT